MSNSRITEKTNANSSSRRTIDVVYAGLQRRRAAEKRFRFYGVLAVSMAILFLVLLFGDIVGKGHGAFSQTFISIDIYFDEEVIDPHGHRTLQVLSAADYGRLIKSALRAEFPEVNNRREKRMLYGLISNGASYELEKKVVKNQSLLGKTQRVWLPADDEVDLLVKGQIDRTLDESNRRVSDLQIGWVEKLEQQGRVEKRFNTTFFTHGDSRDPEQAGILGAVAGSFFTLIVTLMLSFPIGVATAVYLEEFAPQNKWTDIIEVNINNLAAVPSIVFGLLGLAVFINFFGLPRSAPLVGGLVLTLMTLPTIIISARAALKSVPPSIREAALGVGASRMQMILFHVLPLAMPGMLTGTIIGMAQALGESAPLLMIGMVAFIVDVPGGFTDPSTVLPVQVFLWADSPERAFVEKTSGAIMVLLTFLITMNALAVILRRRFERRW